MNILSLLSSSLAAPHDLWTIIINWIQGGVANFGWTILLFTLLVKVVTSPLDFMVKYSTKKQNLVQKKCAPEIAKLNKKYGNDQNTIKIQTNSLYKREGLNMGIGCIIMLVNMILTMVIFFTLYSSLRKVSAYESITQYEQVEAAYNNAYYDGMVNFDENDNIIDHESAINVINKFAEAKTYIENTENDKNSDEWKNHNEFYEKYKAIFASEKITADALNAATQTWNNVKSSWLWIDNIWMADAATRPLPDYNGLISIARNGGSTYEQYVVNNINKERCDLISSSIIATTGRSANGYYIIAILAAGVTLLSQLISQLQNRLKNKKANNLAKATEKSMGMSMKIMMIVMPIIMLVFALTTGAGFGIYIVTSNIASIILGQISTLIIDRLTKKKRLEVEAYLEKEANRLIRKGQMKG